MARKISPEQHALNEQIADRHRQALARILCNMAHTNPDYRFLGTGKTLWERQLEQGTEARMRIDAALDILANGFIRAETIDICDCPARGGSDCTCVVTA